MLKCNCGEIHRRDGHHLVDCPVRFMEELNKFGETVKSIIKENLIGDSVEAIEGVVTGGELVGDKMRVTIDFPYSDLTTYKLMVTMGEKWSVNIPKKNIL